jgi:sugar lactone lactonase YvrE
MPVKLTIANHSSSFATISNLTAPTILGSGANSNVTVTGNELIVYPGSTNTSNYGAGYDTLTLKTTTEAYGGGVASLAFANSNTGYPLGRIYAVDTGTVPTGSSSSLVFQSAVSNKLVPAMTITGSNVTLSGTIGGVTLSGGAINNVPATPTLYNVTTVSSSLPANIGIASAYDASTGSYYVAYNNGTTVYKITSAGVVTVFAGNGSYSASVNGTGTNASLNVKDMLCDAVGNIYFVENGTSSAIRKITPAGVVTTLAGSPGLASTVIDGTGTNARFNYYVYGLCIDTAGTFLYAADWAPGNILRKINISTAEVTTITFTPSWYGGGFYPCWDATTGTIIGVSTQFYRITTSGATTLLTSSTGIQANDACIDANGNIYAVDYNYGGGGLIWKYTTATNTFVVIAGNNTSGSADGLGTAATFSTSASGTVAVDPSGNIYVGDNGRVRKLTPLSGSGGILPFNNSLYTSNSSTALTVQAPFSCAKTISIQQIQETLNTIASPGSGTVVADWSTGDIWYVTSMTANFTINLTNLPTTANKSYSVVFTLVQGATPYYISALQIAGVAQTIKWPGASAPTATASRVETETFTLMYTGSAWTVLGQLTSFG